MIFNDINVNGREIWEIEHSEVPRKIWMGFEIGLFVNEAQFSKTRINNPFLV